jgi:hypothetical protein
MDCHGNVLMSEHAGSSMSPRRQSLLIVMLVYWLVFGVFALTVWRELRHIPGWRNEVNFNQV